jgi:putative PEP-CTERM system TPR-repeat lipoprotein
MRRIVFIGIPALVLLLVGAAVWYRLSWHGDALQAARLRMLHGNMRGAELYLREAVREHPHSGEAAFRLGEVDLALGNPGGAELELRRARADGYDQQATLLPLAQAMLEQHHFDQVLREFDPVQAPQGSRGQMLAVRASAELAQGDLAAAASDAAAAERASPADTEVLMTAARVALAQGDVAGADARANRILAADPKQPEALLLKSDLALRRSDAKGALAAADQAVAAAPTRLDVHLARARALTALGRDKEARAGVEEVLKSAPKDPGANYLRMILALRHGDYPAADASLSVLSPYISTLPRGLYYLAVTKLGVGQPAQAEEAAAKFLSQSPGDPAGKRLMAFIDLARLRPAPALELLRHDVESGHADADTLGLYARAQAMTGDLQGASRNLAQASTLEPANTALLNRLAAVQLDLGQTDAAEAELKRSLALKPAQQDASGALVQAALARGDIEEARATVDRLRASTGETEALGVLAAQVSLAAFDLDGAERQLRGVLARTPDSRAATLGLAQIDALRGDRAADETLLEDWLRRHPADSGVLGLLLPSLLGDGQAKTAVSLAEAAHEAAASDLRITVALAQADVQDHAPDRALALLDRAGAESVPELEAARAQILLGQGRKQEAASIYAKMLEQAPGNVAMRRNLAVLQADLQDGAAARQTLRDGLALSPGNAPLLAALVALDLKEHGIQAALATARGLQADARNLPNAASLAGDAWLASHDPAQAAQAFEDAFNKAPSALLAAQSAAAYSASGQAEKAASIMTGWLQGHPEDMSGQAQLAGIDLVAGRLDQAGAILRKVLAARPGDAGVLNNLAWIAMKQGDFAQAATLAKRAYVRAPSPAVADTLGWILVKQNDLPHAATLLALGAASPTADQGARRYHYAFALNAQGHTQDARAQLQQALADPAPFDEREDAKHLLETLGH